MSQSKHFKSPLHQTLVKEGDKLVPDSGFDCMKEGIMLVVKKDENGLYLSCDKGCHYLSGQVNGEGFLIGLYQEEKE